MLVEENLDLLEQRERNTATVTQEHIAMSQVNDFHLCLPSAINEIEILVHVPQVGWEARYLMMVLHVLSITSRILLQNIMFLFLCWHSVHFKTLPGSVYRFCVFLKFSRSTSQTSPGTRVKLTSLHDDASAALEGMREEVHLLQHENKTLGAAMTPLADLQGDMRDLTAKVASLKEETAAKVARDNLEDTLTLSRLAHKVCSIPYDPFEHCYTITQW